jgi:RimJ/RimL family protein N-acetyltransferase
VTSVEDWPPAPPLRTERLSLEPLRVDHAEEMAPLLADARLYEFTGGDPPSLERLRASYVRRVSAGGSDGRRWCNWVVRARESGLVVGGMQAYVSLGEDGFAAELAWIVGREHQGRGYAREAAAAVVAWLREQAEIALIAEIHASHSASMRVARALGLAPTTEPPEHAGDVRWRG